MTEQPPFLEDEAGPKYNPFMGGRSLLDILGRPIAFHRCLVDVTGSIASALLLSQAIHWQKWADKQADRGGWFYKTTADWMEETGLGRDEFQAARRKLVDAGILLYEVKGVPATGHYRIDSDALSLRIFRKLDCGSSENKIQEVPETSIGEIRNLPNRGTKNTTKTTAARAIEGGTARGQLCKILRAQGVNITPGHPLIQDWLTAGATEAQLLEAVARARLNKPEGPIAANYLAPIVTEILHPREYQSKTIGGIAILERMKRGAS